MIKNTVNVVIFSICIIISLGIPGYVYKYEAVLSGKVLALNQDFQFFVNIAKTDGKTLEEFFNEFKKEGKYSSIVANYEKEKLDTLILYHKQLEIFKEEKPISSLTAIITSSSKFNDIQQTTFKLFKFDLALINSLDWLILCAMVTFILFGIIKLLFYAAFNRKTTIQPMPA